MATFDVLAGVTPKPPARNRWLADRREHIGSLRSARDHMITQATNPYVPPRYVVWHDHMSRRWRWARAWTDNGLGLVNHGAAPSFASAIRKCRENDREHARHDGHS